MKYLFLFLLITCSFTLLGGAAACSEGNDEVINGGNSGNPEEPENTENMKVEIKIGETTFIAALQNNSTATAFKEMLPLTIHMNDLNSNEKFYIFSGSLPTAATRPGIIRNGDLMLYGNNCLVLFYKTFSSSYSYTTIGAIDNPAGLEAAVGAGSVIVTFSLTKN